MMPAGAIHPIGLGQQAARLRELAHPERVGHGRLLPALCQEAVRQTPVAAGGFHHHKAAGLEPGGQPGDPGRVVRHRQPPPAGQAAHVEPRLADVDPDHPLHPPSPPCLRS
jgi:hypothetical protein